MKAVKFLSVLCAVIFTSGIFAENIFCQNPENTKPVDKITTVAPDKNGNDNLEQQILARQRTNEKYRIGFQDTIEIQVYNHPALNRVANVSPDGTILMPKIDKPIIAACKTERELEATITTLYQSYLKNPFVSVRAVEQRSQPFAVIGAVEKPGSFYLNRKIRLLELLAFAGGPKVEKAGSKIQVARVGNVAGCSEPDDAADEVKFLSYKVKEVMAGDINPWMEPGDIVSVLEADEAYVTGNVIKPAIVSLKEPVTLTQAIARAGGLAPEAKINKVTIQRQDANSPTKTETVYDLKEIIAQKIPDPVLQANDIVNVPKDNVKSVRNGFIKAISGGIGNIFYRFP